MPVCVCGCVCCSEALIPVCFSLFLNTWSPEVVSVLDGKFFLGNSYTSYFIFLSNYFRPLNFIYVKIKKTIHFTALLTKVKVNKYF